MQLCKYVFPIGLLLYVPKMWFLGVLRWRCENIVFWPPKGTTLREYASVDVSRDKIGSTAWALGRWKDFCIRRKKFKKLSGNFGYMGKSNPWAILTECGLWEDMVDVITCAIFRDCRLRGVGVVRGVSLPSPIDLRRRLYNTGHTTVWSHYRVTVWSSRPTLLPDRNYHAHRFIMGARSA